MHRRADSTICDLEYLGLLLSLRVGLLMRGMSEFLVAVVDKIIFYSNRIFKINIKVANYEYVFRL